MSWFALTRSYAALYGRVHDTLHLDLPGFGTLVDRVREDHELRVNGLRLHFDHQVGRCYGRLLAGEWNEAETHHFLRALLDATPGRVTAVDVGAFIGELALELARHPRSAGVLAFEPQPRCAAACAQSAVLNGFGHVQVVNAALSDEIGRAHV